MASSVIKKNIHIQRGKSGASFASGDISKIVNVVFDYAFPTNPCVTASLVSGTNNRNNVFLLAITNVSTTGFTIQLWRQIGATNDVAEPAFDWIAINY